jgi:hypothetical protein
MQRVRSLTDAPVAEFLQESRLPLRLAFNGASGHPLLESLWFAPVGERIWCATPVVAGVAKRLAIDPRCSFEVSEESMPYRGVRGRGTATLLPDRGPEILDTLIERYLASERVDFANWLRARADREVAIAVDVLDLVTWDFSKRMDTGQ